MNNFIPDINKLNNDKSIDNKEDNYFNSLTTETSSRKKKNSDVINLSELSKIKLEYERDDVKMNNGQFNNNFGQPELNQGPAFGGRFFPSLEDEPTNMNMMGGLNNGPSIPNSPIAPETMMVPNMNSNLIDLTDLSIENEPNSMSIPSMEQSVNIPITNPMGVNGFNSVPSNGGEMPNMDINPMPSLNSSQNNNPSVSPSTEPVSIDILNADFGAPQPMPNFGTVPTMPSMPESMMETPQSIPNFGISPTMSTMPGPMSIPTPPVNINMPQSGNFGEPMIIPNIDPNVSIPSFDNNVSIPNVETNTVSTKDVTPVTNAIKSLVNSLTEFGYKINIIEDDLINVSKLTIEIEK